MDQCVTCAGTDQDLRLNKCPICFHWTCEGCGTAQYGRIFCTKKCADSFFFGDDDEGGDV